MTPLVEKSCVSLVKRLELAAQSDKSVEMKECVMLYWVEDFTLSSQLAVYFVSTPWKSFCRQLLGTNLIYWEGRTLKMSCTKLLR